jgi:3-hydroxybutyryl-CoA dehydrogenase
MTKLRNQLSLHLLDMKLNKIVVIGAGTMGSGIAQWFTQQGCFVELVDNSEEQLNTAKASIYSSWNKLAEKGKLTHEEIVLMKEHLKVTSLENTQRDSDLVIEAIIEDLSIKKSLFEKVDKHFNSMTIVASNTSSFPITQMAEAVSPQRKDRFIGLHFFNPATIMPLVEIIRGDQTSSQLCQDLYQWFETNGKKPALCKDSPGFIVNRVARNFYGEPLRVAGDEDESKIKEIDSILKDVGGFKMGPFELMDLIGIDVNYSVTCSVWKAYQEEPRFAPHHLQKKLVEEGRLGRKTKRGFFKYD